MNAGHFFGMSGVLITHVCPPFSYSYDNKTDDVSCSLRNQFYSLFISLSIYFSLAVLFATECSAQHTCLSFHCICSTFYDPSTLYPNHWLYFPSLVSRSSRTLSLLCPQLLLANYVAGGGTRGESVPTEHVWGQES